MDLAYKTAISRKNPSAPMRWLWDNDRLFANQFILDYGCGKGKDIKWLNEIGYLAWGYDPHYAPNTIRNGLANAFDVITCMFVLNVIESDLERQSVVRHIIGLLKSGGHAYVAIRADKAKLNSYTKIGTYQTYVRMQQFGFKLIHKRGSYELFEYVKP
jgi:DNA phosphorothioation-associated putative methyltransferase